MRTKLNLTFNRSTLFPGASPGWVPTRITRWIGGVPHDFYGLYNEVQDGVELSWRYETLTQGDMGVPTGNVLTLICD